MTNTKAELREKIAQVIYEDQPLYDSGEVVEGHQVIPHGFVPWDALCNFGEHGRSFEDACYKLSDAILALLPPAPTVGDLTDDMLRDRISELEGALEPFANVAQKVLEQTDDHWDAYVTLNGMGNIDSFHRDVFRNAAHVLGGDEQ